MEEKEIEITEKSARMLHYPTFRIVFKNDCVVEGNLTAKEVIALESLTVQGSVEVISNLIILGSLFVEENLLSHIGDVLCKRAMKVKGKVTIGKTGRLEGSIIEVGDIEVGGELISVFQVFSEKDIFAGKGIVAGTSVEAKELVRVGEGYKIFAGVTVKENEENVILREIRAQEILGKIGHGIPKISQSA